LKIRLHQKLASRKFERDRVERYFRRQQYNGKFIHGELYYN
jgi:hypothetical protein